MEPADRIIHDVKYLSDPSVFKDFQERYLEVRKKENRLFTDDEVKGLPYLPSQHPHRKEWLLREDTFKRFIQYLKKKHLEGPVLDLGCGNGWFSYKIAEMTGQNVTGLDVNIHELEQAARVFQGENIIFCFGDIFEDVFDTKSFNLIILNASAQYFPDIGKLIERLMHLLKKDGEIHLLDTHFYRDERSAAEAADRTRKYYSGMGFPEMASHYHHHQLKNIYNIDTTKVNALYKTSNLKHKILKIILRNISPFPWIRIRIK